jgi:hypothetical protein
LRQTTTMEIGLREIQADFLREVRWGRQTQPKSQQIVYGVSAPDMPLCWHAPKGSCNCFKEGGHFQITVKALALWAIALCLIFLSLFFLRWSHEGPSSIEFLGGIRAVGIHIMEKHLNCAVSFEALSPVKVIDPTI